MTNLESESRRLSTVESLASLETEAALDRLALLIDLAGTVGRFVEAIELWNRSLAGRDLSS
jgi:hypothetical protein